MIHHVDIDIYPLLVEQQEQQGLLLNVLSVKSGSSKQLRWSTSVPFTERDEA